ncbi:hypothetical protein BV898_00865 [Hypsibius exemplaris]|uniref:Uncharacterized protein n=1 Tax=Hypsibius exemplaris TaxID=2072580 RepID=A0A1W0XCE2_HYPEX|nr:hypothetical protein BV898_00865 [Hypsibius exemplaris]
MGHGQERTVPGFGDYAVNRLVLPVDRDDGAAGNRDDLLDPRCRARDIFSGVMDVMVNIPTASHKQRHGHDSRMRHRDISFIGYFYFILFPSSIGIIPLP